MSVEVTRIDLRDRKRVRQFLELPYQIYRDNPCWVPSFYQDARRILDRRRNPFFQHSEAEFFLAFEGSQVVGRLAILDNRHYNEFNQSRTGFFYLFECRNHPDASAGLFDSAIHWAGSRQLTKIIGPKGFSALDGLGLLVEGFHHRPALGIPYNPDYYPALLEASGFEPIGDILSGYLDEEVTFPDRIHELAERIRQRRGIAVAQFNKRSDLRSLIPRLKDMYNGSIQGTSGNVPLTDSEVQTIADQMLRFADPRLIKILMKEGEPIGFLFAYPDISAAIQRTKGHIYPFGWIFLLREFRRTKWVNIDGAGIIEEYRGLGGTALLFSEMFKSIAEGGFRKADIVQIGAENERMLRELTDLGVEFYKRHRVYQRQIPLISGVYRLPTVSFSP